MTDEIPDDVVAKAYEEWDAVLLANPLAHPGTILRAIGRVFLEWERAKARDDMDARKDEQ